METLRKLIIVVALLILSIFPIYAEEESEFDSNSQYYYQLCSSNSLSEEDKKTCDAFAAHLAGKSSSLREQLRNIEAQREEIAKDIEKAAQKIRGYNVEIQILGNEIGVLNKNIEEKEQQIETKQNEITQKEEEINALKQKVKNRMVEAQSTMRFNKLLDFLMGAQSIEDLIRRSNGISSIATYDNKVRQSLINLIHELEIAKAELEAEKVVLDENKKSLEEKQFLLIVKRKEAELVKVEYLKKEAELEASYGQIVGDLDGIKKMIASIADKLGNIPSSSGFIRPVPGARISAGTWYYPQSFGGGIHLGIDYAAPKGTPVYAPANGVVILSVDGCGDGYLGNTCGGTGGGNAKGGNQMAMIVRVDGKTYAVKYYHLLINTPVARGTTVMAGDKVAETGTSGNSTGPHTHVEVFYLGTNSIADYVASWNGDMSFGTGWGSATFRRLCENGVGAPCRVKPESVFE
ncbi:hypothetical protein EII25_06515 [Erysipelotrichaceae bacterium OH741_COT-311]|nr:hypothetical protein EII25_06515 [Erysipelotrichaceae bacterium OH741_COT-311]